MKSGSFLIKNIDKAVDTLEEIIQEADYKKLTKRVENDEYRVIFVISPDKDQPLWKKEVDVKQPYLQLFLEALINPSLYLENENYFVEIISITKK